MKMDVSKFKKISSDKNQTVLKHPRGHQIVIAHNALTPALKKQIHQIPAMAEGGEVKNFDDGGESTPGWLERANKFVNSMNEDANTVSSNAADTVGASNAAANSAADQAMQDTQGQAPLGSLQNPGKEWAGPAPEAGASGAFLAGQENQPGQGPAPAATGGGHSGMANDPYAGYAGVLQKGLAGMGAAAQAEAKAQGELGKQQADILQKQNDALQKIQFDGQQRVDNYMNQADAVAKDVANGHIDPKHYMESMSTGKRVATAIGLILGGMGAGLTGGENPAQKFLEQQINRDVDAQKANLGKQENLYSHFIRMGETAQNATKLATAFTANIYANQALAAAAKMQDPITRAQTEQKINAWKLQYAPMIQQAGVQGAAINAMRGTSDPESKIRLGMMSGIVPKEEADKMFDELNAVKNHANQSDTVLKYFDKAAGDNTLANRTLHAGFQPASVAAFQNTIMPYLKDAEGRINETELERTDKIIPSPGDTSAKQALKRQALVDFLHEKSPKTERLQAYGINPQQYGRFNDQGQKKLQLGPPVR